MQPRAATGSAAGPLAAAPEALGCINQVLKRHDFEPVLSLSKGAAKAA